MMVPVMAVPMMPLPMPIVADAPRPVIGQDDAATAVGIVVTCRIGRIIVASIAVEVTAMMMEVRPIGIVRTMIAAATVKRRTATVEHRTRATTSEGVTAATMKGRTAAASEHRAAAMERRAATAAVEAATTAAVETTSATAVEATTATMTATTSATMTATATRATHLDRHRVGRRLWRRPSVRADWRHRERRPTGRARQYEQCCRRKTEATSKTSPLVFHPHHGPFSLNAVQRWTHAAPMLVVRSVDWRTPNMNVEIAT